MPPVFFATIVEFFHAVLLRDFPFFRVGLIAVTASLTLTLGGCSQPVVERQVAGVSGYTTSKNYQLVPNDLVRVEVFQEPDMLTEQRISQDGTVNVALVGRVRIAGLTLEAASAAVASRLKAGYLVNPQVTVNVVEYAPRRFSVLGEVNRPGAFEIPGEEVVTLPTAVAMAGGNSRIANLRRVLVTRNRDGKIYDIKVDLLTPEGRQFIVEKGDMILVPESLF